MYGVINGAGDQTLKAYRDSIDVNKNAVAPTAVQGGVIRPNNVSNILPAANFGVAGSARVSVMSAFAGVLVALLASR
jgi:hypothetical protein